MTEEFYHQDLFGTVVDVNLGEEEEREEAIGPRKQSDFNIFALTDAFGARKKKEVWILYQEALLSGVSAEEVFYKIIWQLKSMLLASKTKSVSETDMKPFPYNKAKSFLKNFKQEELENLSQDLVVGYNLARRGQGDIETLIEKTILSL